MSDDKKYYYLKFKENHFEQDHIKYLETMDNGYIYSLILIKLYLKAIKYDGQLRVNEFVPYEASKIPMLAKMIGHDSDHVMHAINSACSLGIIEIVNSGEIWMADIQNYIGHSSTEADRIRDYRKKLKTKHLPKVANKDEKGAESQYICTPELKIELEKEIEVNRKYYYNTWNNLASKEDNNLSKINSVTSKRALKIKTRLRETDFGKDFAMCVDLISKSPFLLGQNNREWCASFDWLIENDTNYIKVLENKYQQKNAPPILTDDNILDTLWNFGIKGVDSDVVAKIKARYTTVHDIKDNINKIKHDYDLGGKE